MENQDNKFWAIVELFGHTILAGQVSKSDFFDFAQINIPQVGFIPAWSKLLNPKSIYAITPCSEETALQKAAAVKEMPINSWDAERLFKNRFEELVQQGRIKNLEPEKVEEEEEEFEF